MWKAFIYFVYITQQETVVLEGYSHENSFISEEACWAEIHETFDEIVIPPPDKNGGNYDLWGQCVLVIPDGDKQEA